VRDAHPSGRRRRLGLPLLGVIALGGAAGGVARYEVSRALASPSGGVPWATFLANTAGCFTLAVLLVVIADRWPPHRYLRPLLGIGFLGAFTTFSTWVVDGDRLVRHEHWAAATGFLLGGLAAGVGATALGLAVGRLAAHRGPRRGQR
jgi:CrcB protein